MFLISAEFTVAIETICSNEQLWSRFMHNRINQFKILHAALVKVA